MISPLLQQLEHRSHSVLGHSSWWSFLSHPSMTSMPSSSLEVYPAVCIASQPQLSSDAQRSSSCQSCDKLRSCCLPSLVSPFFDRSAVLMISSSSKERHENSHNREIMAVRLRLYPAKFVLPDDLVGQMPLTGSHSWTQTNTDSQQDWLSDSAATPEQKAVDGISACISCSPIKRKHHTMFLFSLFITTSRKGPIQHEDS